MKKKTITAHLLCELLRQSRKNASAPVIIKGTDFFIKYTRTANDNYRGIVYPCNPTLSSSQVSGVRVSVNYKVPYGEFEGFTRLVQLGIQHNVAFILGKGTRESGKSFHTPLHLLARRLNSILYA